MTSELDSIASGSTLTTRSRRRGAPGPQVAPPKSKKGGGRVSKTGSATTNNSVNSSSTKGKQLEYFYQSTALNPTPPFPLKILIQPPKKSKISITILFLLFFHRYISYFFQFHIVNWTLILFS